MSLSKRKICFSKMHGLENDFIVLNNIKNNFFLTSKIIQDLSHRHTGIGFDQLLLLECSKQENIDFHYRIFNSNGSEVSQCGNGARCLALFITLKKLTKKKVINVSTKNRIIILYILKNRDICVDMGIPVFEPKYIPYSSLNMQKYYSALILGKIIKYYVVSIGNPHCIIIEKNIKRYPVKKIGFILSNHILFPEGTNVGFMELISETHISLRVYERGVGETRSCGSGACAAVAIGIKEKMLLNEVKVSLLGGDLKIKWNGNLEKLYMTGSARHVYDGYFYL
ncbi:diaminopimelate epimerase [Buchnera aphidicola]|uniref:Diaminopimelate epimerase n=1 Tax=Buchnera aphidicola subsp. Melaphis rhois TaxID=118103 RepID=A0A4D6YAU7_BUCMH|nr:diaminopimelate epimerase [Buchnera aphidicola]QCI23541.1 diaminopimelate epimerase [Buchnera aphidicola (Melaphis rhois)]